MSVIKSIVLTQQGNNAGPYYEVSCSNDCSTYTPCPSFTGSLYLPSVGSQAYIEVYDTTTCIKLVNSNDYCNNAVVHSFAASGSTTTTSTTTGAPTTTTTTATPTTTTTTTAGPTTTTTTCPVCNTYVVTNNSLSQGYINWYDCNGNVGNHFFPGPVGPYTIPCSSTTPYWSGGASGPIVKGAICGFNCPTTTTTTTAAPTTTTTTIAYDFYLADEYSCFPCTLTQTDVLVAFPAGTSYIGTHYYSDIGHTGFVYKITSSTTSGVAIILDTLGSSTNCNSVCSL